MNEPVAPATELADPERALAVAYAPAGARRALEALFRLDERFGLIVSSTTEPMIGLMRLVWWREALEKIDRDRDPVPAEPLLHLLAGAVLSRGVTGAALAEIEDGWAALLDGEPDADAVLRHGRARGRTLFAAAATILGAADVRIALAGEIWALADLGLRHSRPELRAASLARAAELAGTMPSGRWPVAARPLAALYVLARRDAMSGARIPASPGRVLRMLALRLTGR